MPIIKRFFFLLITVLSFSVCSAQESKINLTRADSSQFASPQNVLISSVLIPGLGQLKQERLWKTTLFYGVAATFYYRTADNYYKYKKENDKTYLNKAKNDLAIAGVTHFLNIIDAWYYGYNKKPMGWNGALFNDKPLKSPWGATLRSAMLPGWGQFYNESYVKSAVYAGLVSYVGYQVYWNTKKYDETGLEEYEDDRSRYSWYLGLTYLLMLTDAHVDAHLFEFDKAVELAVIPSPNSGAISLNLKLSF
ncbi:MAG: hypothetical protein D8M58_03700 [Calditrichaeota bacterium]|nr:MAG: hypothetical protein DWQ03_03375 [Calditrichota bacterium]MBL1204471.1 hypothetical protein [Calditrichota bacterium]NOG44300.1 hypothetical protein [Calditrichota bacterium]